MLTPEELLENKNITLYELNSDDKQARAVKILWEGLSQVINSVKELKDTGASVDIDALIERIKEELEGEGVEVQLAEPSKIDSLFV